MSNEPIDREGVDSDAQSMAPKRDARENTDRRAQNRGRSTKLDPENVVDSVAERKARLKAFSDRWKNSAIPDFPVDMIPGFRLCWVATNNPRDTPESRMALGYILVTRDRLPKQFQVRGSVAGDRMTQGNYGNAVIAGDLVLMALPEDEWYEVMKAMHHDEPYEFHRDMIDSAQALAGSHRGGKVHIEDDMYAEAGRIRQTPIFN